MPGDKNIVDILYKNMPHYHPVVPFDKSKEKTARFDLSKTNLKFTSEVYNDMQLFEAFINEQRSIADAKYLVGGYKELRQMYLRSTLFDANEEPRSLHLGVDIWGDAGTKICTPLGGTVHSFNFNNNFGDYGATIILQHQLETLNFYLLYGHLSLKDIEKIRKGQFITRGQEFAHFGLPSENGNWPPHLHFQLILDMGILEGDYPGVCKLSEAEKFLKNSPDPAVLLNI